MCSSLKQTLIALLVVVSSVYAADTRVGAPPAAAAKDLNLIVDADSSGKSAVSFQLGSEMEDSFKMVFNAKDGDVFNVRDYENKALLKVLGADRAKTVGDMTGVRKATTAFVETNTRVGRAKALLRKLNRRLLSTAVDEANSTEVAASGAASFSRMITAPEGKLTASGKIVSTNEGKVTVQNKNQWRMVVEEDFVKGSVLDWQRESGGSNVSVSDQVTTCAKHPHGDSDFFLGAFSNVRVMKTFQLPFHESIRVTARVHFLDKWEGQVMYMKTNNGVKWSKAHKWCNEFPEKKCQPTTVIENGALDTCGDPNFSDTLSVPVDVSFPAYLGSKSLTVEFGGLLTDGTTCKAKSDCEKNSFECIDGQCVNTKATWGIDDVRIYVK